MLRPLPSVFDVGINETINFSLDTSHRVVAVLVNILTITEMQTQLFRARLNWLARALNWLLISCGHANPFSPCRLLTQRNHQLLCVTTDRHHVNFVLPRFGRQGQPQVFWMFFPQSRSKLELLHLLYILFWFTTDTSKRCLSTEWQRHLNNHIISGLAGLAFKVQWEHLKMRKTNTDEVMGDECWLALLAIPPIIWLSQMNHNARRWKYSHRLQVMARYNSRHLFN